MGVYQKLTTLVHHLRAVQEHYSRGRPLAVMVLSCMVPLVGEEGQALEHLGGLPGVIVYLEWEEEPGMTRPGPIYYQIKLSAMDSSKAKSCYGVTAA